jgi:hypothetical protein
MHPAISLSTSEYPLFMVIETFADWQLETAYLDWKLEQYKPEPLEVLALGEPEYLRLGEPELLHKEP